MMLKKTIGYAYPTSEYAKQFGNEKIGWYYVGSERLGAKVEIMATFPVPDVYDADDIRKEVQKAFDAVDLPAGDNILDILLMQRSQ